MDRRDAKGRRAALALFFALILATTLAGWMTGGVAARGLALTRVAYLPLMSGGPAQEVTPGPTTPAPTPTPTVTPGPTPQAGPYDQLRLAWTGNPSTTLTMAWRTWEPTSPSEVMYRAAGEAAWQTAAGAERPSGSEGKLHEVMIGGLQPNTAYEYRVRTDAGGWSPAFTARTAPTREAATFDAVYLADTGIAGRLDGLATGTEQIIDEIRALDPLVLLGGGDYAYFDKDKRFGTLDATIDAWFNQMAPIASRAPLMATYGNHEADPDRGEELAAWVARFSTPPRSAGLYDYSFDVGDVHFISVFAALDYTGVSSAQAAWLDQDMADARSRKMNWIVPYFHVPMFGDGANHGPNMMLREKLGPLFEKHGAELVFFSHDQSYERSFPLTDVPKTNMVTSTSLNCYGPNDGVVYVKVSPAGKESNISGAFSPFRSAEKPYWTAYRDNTMHHFARLRVSPGNLNVEGWGVMKDASPAVVLDQFRITKGTCP